MEAVTTSTSTSVVDQGYASSGVRIDFEDSEGEETPVPQSTAQQSEPVKSDTDSLIGTHLDISV